MNSTFKIVKHLDTGELFLAAPYWLDPQDKMTIFCEYTEGIEPVMEEYGMHNEYMSEIEIIGEYESSRYTRSDKNMITDYHKIMDDYHEAMTEYHSECERHNNRILNAIKGIKGEQFFEDLMTFMEDCEVNNKFKIVRKPAGEYQSENYGKIKRSWVVQYSVGDSGDSWAGTVSVKIKKGRWLEMPFSM